MENLEQCREEINRIDRSMAQLFEERMKVAAQIAAYKKEHTLPILDRAREQAVLEKNVALISESELKPYYTDFQKKVMRISRSYQARLMSGMMIGYSGLPGAYGFIASKRLFPDAELVSFTNFEPAYRAAENGMVDCAVLPMENSYAGEVGEVMDLLFSGGLYVNRVMNLEVEHYLLGVPGATVDKVKTVVSHPQAIAQCETYIKKHGFEVLDYSNTARAAKFVKERNDPTIAAIASEEAADLFGLKILERKIHSTRNNASRFGVFSRSLQVLPEGTKDDSCGFILLFTVPNEAGALALTLDIIGSHGFNMRNLRSRPMKGLQWKYYFYVEAEGNISREEGQNMLQELRAVCGKLKLAGTFLNE